MDLTPLRPPRTDRLPVLFPLSLASGARPASFATALPERVPISGISASTRATVRPATPFMERKLLSSWPHRGSLPIKATIRLSSSRICRPTRASSSSNERLASGSRTRRRWLDCMVRRSTSWRSRVTAAAKVCWPAVAGGRGTMRLASLYQAMAAASILSVFSSSPMACANCLTERGLTIAEGMPSFHSRPKARRSWPPVASIATSPTPWSRQNAASSAIPAAEFSNRR